MIVGDEGIGAVAACSCASEFRSAVPPVIAQVGWVPEEEWRLIEGRVPIACIDVLPWRRSPGGDIEVGLISRIDANDGETRLNLVGGAIRLNESVELAVERHVRETLGPKVHWEARDYSTPEFAGQYLTYPTSTYGYDSRHHAVSFSYTLEIWGEVEAQGEARSITYFPVTDLPAMDLIGFAQGPVVHALASTLRPGRT
jgi:ADP-ribose pyrophosphatase YjhB (NUDIX family)